MRANNFEIGPIIAGILIAHREVALAVGRAVPFHELSHDETDGRREHDHREENDQQDQGISGVPVIGKVEGILEIAFPVIFPVHDDADIFTDRQELVIFFRHPVVRVVLVTVEQVMVFDFVSPAPLVSQNPQIGDFRARNQAVLPGNNFARDVPDPDRDIYDPGDEDQYPQNQPEIVVRPRFGFRLHADCLLPFQGFGTGLSEIFQLTPNGDQQGQVIDRIMILPIPLPPVKYSIRGQLRKSKNV